MNFIQRTVQVVEAGKGQVLARIVPLLVALIVIGGTWDVWLYRGLNDAQSMDNAQLARQISRGQGFTTEFLRPYAVEQLHDYAMTQGLLTGRGRDLFPAEQFPAGTPRILPDTYNAPGYPYLLAIWFRLTHPEFAQTSGAMFTSHFFSGERWIPVLNQGFMLLTALLVFALGRSLFDDRVAWISLVAFLSTELVWRYTSTALSTSVLMFLVTAAVMCALEIYRVSEACFENENLSFASAWLWALAVGFLLAAATLTRLNLMVLLVPLFVLLILMPRGSLLLFAVIAVIVGGCVTPWFVHLNTVSGNPFGSNMPLLLLGEGEYSGNQIYCTATIPGYEQMFRDASRKEWTGFIWHFNHAWTLLGANPLILFFGASILHQFKRRRTRAFHWLVFGCAFVLVGANNLGSATPDDLGPWNVLVLLFPCMLVIGAAFFFILLDRLNLMIRLLQHLIVTTMMVFAVIPLVLTLVSPSNLYYNFPPYMPPEIKSIAELAAPDEWVTSDMPWATAWYGDRASLWLPDSVNDFLKLNDNVCPTGVLLVTPVSLDQPLSTFTGGEYKDWLPFLVGTNIPPTFPLSAHAQFNVANSYYGVWSDRNRWEGK